VASFPRDLTIPQLLRSSASAILLPESENKMTVFPHRGLAPHQFTPMSGAHKPDAVNPAMALRLTIEDQWRRVTDLER
jgi:hypothetical protein